MAIVASYPAHAAAAVRAARHGDATFLAELRPFGLHASSGLGHVRDRIAAEPHRIGRTGLLDVGGHLGTGSANAAKKEHANRQRQPAHKENGSHLVFPGVQRFFRYEGK
jgi:hypothetical protein